MLTKASLDAVAPTQVASLLRGKLRFDPETKQVVVMDDLGGLATDGKGNYLTVEMLVTNFLNDNPHFRKAAGGTGANSTPGNARPPGSVTPPAPDSPGQGVDLARAQTDIEYALKHQTEIEKMLKEAHAS